jgi:hypothetical protein
VSHPSISKEPNRPAGAAPLGPSTAPLASAEIVASPGARRSTGGGLFVHRNRLVTSIVGSCALILGLFGCAPDAPRALVLADGTGVVHSLGVNDRVTFFQQKTGRQVRVLTVPAEQAVLLAGRGEADVAVVPMDTALDKFLAREDGTIAGLFTHKGDKMKVLEVNAKQHPKVEPKGAHDLASAMTAP